ncbi:Detected protein of confused Function [Hibiscus syriacus]|uniref:Detected protein of confused Function n=1 Tax=Hibiscus syriacus TaxID=106335 RepID=A0A6A2YD26_HIBSY|nr:Detected protein of confused Function [Hibiscus syriacus]
MFASLQAMGMKLVKKVDRPEYKYSIATMGHAEEHETTVLELTYSYEVTEYTKENAYAQCGSATVNIKSDRAVTDYRNKEGIQEKRGINNREPRHPQFSLRSHDPTLGLERASHGKATWDPTQGAKPMFHNPSAPTRVTSSRYKARR